MHCTLSKIQQPHSRPCCSPLTLLPFHCAVKTPDSRPVHFAKFGAAGCPVEALIDGKVYRLRLRIFPATLSRCISRGSANEQPAAAVVVAAGVEPADAAEAEDEMAALAMAQEEEEQEQERQGQRQQPSREPAPIDVSLVLRSFVATISTHLASCCIPAKSIGGGCSA